MDSAKYISLVTFRMSGERMPTAVWFAKFGDSANTYGVITETNAGKVKRIRNNPSIVVEPADRAGKTLGDAVTAHAQLISDPAVATHANALLTQKYGFMKRMFDLIALLNGGLKNRAYVVITPAQ